MTRSRRSLFIFAGGAAIALAVPRLLQQFSPLPDARPIPGLPDFSQIETDGLTQAPALMGLESGATGIEAEIAQVQRDPHKALFPEFAQGTVPIAVFTDVNCSNCRQMSPMLVEMTKHRDDVAMFWYELPLLGPSSIDAAKAALAARLQGGYLAVHETLMRTQFRPSPAYIRTLAEAGGIDAGQMARDLDGPEVSAQLRRASALGYVFGIPGTPAFVINDLLVIGTLTKAQMSWAIRRAHSAAG